MEDKCFKFHFYLLAKDQFSLETSLVVFAPSTTDAVHIANKFQDFKAFDVVEYYEMEAENL